MKQCDTLDHELVELFRNIGHRFRPPHHINSEAGQGRIANIVYEQGTISVKELRDKLGIMAGSLSEMVQKLELKGIIQRSASINDKRVVMITITPHGKEVVERHRQRHNPPPEVGLFAELTEDEKKELARLLRKIRATPHKAV